MATIYTLIKDEKEYKGTLKELEKLTGIKANNICQQPKGTYGGYVAFRNKNQRPHYIKVDVYNENMELIKHNTTLREIADERNYHYQSAHDHLDSGKIWKREKIYLKRSN